LRSIPVLITVEGGWAQSKEAKSGAEGSLYTLPRLLVHASKAAPRLHPYMFYERFETVSVTSQGWSIAFKDDNDENRFARAFKIRSCIRKITR